LTLWSKITGQLQRFAPRSRVARVTAYVIAIELILLALKWIFNRFGAARIALSLGQWTSFVGFIVSLLLIFLALRWFRNHVMWSVRNRLIVTYVLIGLVPIALVVLMAVISAYFFAGQFSAYLTVSEIEAQLRRLQAANSSSAELVAKRPSGTLMEMFAADDDMFPGRAVEVLPEAVRPKWLKDGFRSLVLDEGKLYLRAANFVDSRQGRLAVISSVPVGQKLLTQIAADLGPLTMYVPQKDPNNPNGAINVNIDLGRNTPVMINGKPAVGISAGTLPQPVNRWDREFTYYTVVQPPDWKTGLASEEILLIMGAMRPSGLYARLSTATTKWSDNVVIALAALAAMFAVIVLIAWLIGIRLTRTVTYSVANLYKATEHINRGDFTHRIQVRHKDQLGALENAFNSMTESLERLIAEQKEKERLESELEIAHEVQSQLFPQSGSGTRTLELYGTCRPARIVSGDYYDFLADSSETIGIAVGDISGKGISAALLMATIHSAVRAYEQEQAAPAAVATAYGRDTHVRSVPRIRRPSPAQMLWLLNRHLYQTTQPEKYATLFLGFYDDEKRRLTYSNAGHLPPIILGEDGTRRRLDVGGTVVGLFDGVEYQEQTVQLHPGDLFIAFSDGMTEPENDFGEFGEDRLVETIASCRDLPLDRVTEHAVSAVQDWIGAQEQPDDVTLVLARRVG